MRKLHKLSVGLALVLCGAALYGAWQTRSRLSLDVRPNTGPDAEHRAQYTGVAASVDARNLALRRTLATTSSALEASQSSVASEASSSGSVTAASAPKPPLSLASAQRLTDRTNVTEREQAVLAMYGDMVTAFDRDGTDCAMLTNHVEKIVADNASALKQLAQERTKLSEAERAAADQRLQQAAGPELDQLRESLRSALSRCPQAERLQQAIVRVAQANEPS